MNCDTDHTLFVSMLSVKATSKHHSKPAPKHKINASMCKHYAKKETFHNGIENTNEFQLRESVDESWKAMKTIYESAVSTYGVLKTTTNDWAREYADGDLTLYEKKRKHF